MVSRKIIGYLCITLSLICLSLALPGMIESGKNVFMQRLGQSEEEMAAPDESETMAEEILTESEEESGVSLISKDGEREVTSSSGMEGQMGKDPGPIQIDEGQSYEEVIYENTEKERRANEAAYQDMNRKLNGQMEDTKAYLKSFLVEYDQMQDGLISRFIKGKEALFKKELALYCFGHYNSAYTIRKVRFLCMLEDEPDRMTVILEMLTEADMQKESAPDLKLCTYYPERDAFVFYECASR